MASLEEVGLVHRDISLGNMVFENDIGSVRDEDCTGRLADMDLIMPIPEVKPSADEFSNIFGSGTDTSIPKEDVCIAASFSSVLCN